MADDPTPVMLLSAVVTPCHALSRLVTPCHAEGPKGLKFGGLLAILVTPCHALSRVVTLGLFFKS